MKPAVIMRECASAHGVTVEHLLSPRRDRASVLARVMCANRLRRECSLRVSTIARLLGRTYWTALYYVNPAMRRKQRTAARARAQRRGAA